MNNKIKELYNILGSAISSGKSIVNSGFGMVNEDQFIKRATICNSCDLWDANAFGGIGQCKKCLCTGYKLKFSASICPLNKWGAELT